jgi:hypothetical protein
MGGDDRGVPPEDLPAKRMAGAFRRRNALATAVTPRA